ncbi:MAG: hypothetical protein O2955_02340 [Planctomycetota bacterium]|nr:hypothetical protein [Planctomycetota bacterium]MDA1211323.1 hypothetical protein [Planctomycetota bacterium]
MSEIMIAAAAESEYAASFQWYADRSKKAAENSKPNSPRRWRQLLRILSVIPDATINTGFTCSIDTRIKLSIGKRLLIECWW